MNKILFISAVVLVVIAGFFVWRNQSSQPKCLTGNGNTQCAVEPGWQTFTDTKQGITFQYPEELSTTYITKQEWPPVVKLVSGMPACPVELQTANDRSYCAQAQTDGAAGSVYTAYTYSSAVPRINQTIEVSFTLRSIQCANYDDPQKTACDNERTSFNVDDLAYRIIATVSTIGSAN